MGLMADDLWDVSRRGTAELHVDWGGYRAPLELLIDLMRCNGESAHGIYRGQEQPVEELGRAHQWD